VRSLTADEQDLWSRVTATIRPLSRDKKEPRDVELKEPTVPPATSRPAPRVKQHASAVDRAKIGTTLDASWDRRLRDGAIQPDRTIDLHGMNLDTAWQAIDRGLAQAIANGERLVLLITGHHRPGEPPVERGKIRAAVHDWLAASRHAPRIAAVRGASRRHGGGGSLYLVLRRR
jgi:DNA-nicking Smr family endonuclease